MRTIAHTTLGYVFHPRGMTCLNCGFLALSDQEVGRADRILLAATGQAGCPPLDELQCSKKLWVNYDLLYSGLSSEGIFAELQVRRRPCTGFVKYMPYRTPREHREWEDNRRERREKNLDRVAFVALGFALSLLSHWLLTKPGGVKH